MSNYSKCVLDFAECVVHGPFESEGEVVACMFNIALEREQIDLKMPNPTLDHFLNEWDFSIWDHGG